jgi:hypothetical protein
VEPEPAITTITNTTVKHESSLSSSSSGFNSEVKLEDKKVDDKSKYVEDVYEDEKEAVDSEALHGFQITEKRLHVAVDVDGDGDKDVETGGSGGGAVVFKKRKKRAA